MPNALADLIDELKKYDARQPRDDHGKWSNGSGGISVGHALHVAKHEGIAEKHHAGIQAGIESGQLNTREKVLEHIDGLHAEGKAQSQHQKLVDAKTPNEQFSALHPDLQDAFNSLHHDSPEARDVAAQTLINHVSANVHPLPSKPKGMSNLEFGVAKGQGMLALSSARALRDGYYGSQVSSRSKDEGLRDIANAREKRLVVGSEKAHHQMTASEFERHADQNPETFKRTGAGYYKYTSPTGQVTEVDGKSRKIALSKAHEVILDSAIQTGKEVPKEVIQSHENGPNILNRAINKYGKKHYGAAKSIMPDETLIAYGDAIKIVEETPDSYKFGAYLVVFDSPDVSRHRDHFTKSTDYGFENGETRPLMYNHGLDGTIGKTTIGRAQLFIKDDGVWMSGEIKKRKDYLEKHIDRIGHGLTQRTNIKGHELPVFGTSSGATAHSVIRERSGDGHEIKQWHIGEASITPTPAEPLTGCGAIKSLSEFEDEFDGEYKKYDARQPRDDHGKWSDGGGGISVGHALHVAKHEGIAEKHHAGIQAGIESGELNTREKVLEHIDDLHASARALGGKSPKERVSNAANELHDYFDKNIGAGKISGSPDVIARDHGDAIKEIMQRHGVGIDESEIKPIDGGSEKQNAWAEKIRAGIQKQITAPDFVTRTVMTSRFTDAPTWEERAKGNPSAREDLGLALRGARVIAKHTDAKYFINNHKDGLSPDAALRQGKSSRKSDDDDMFTDDEYKMDGPFKFASTQIHLPSTLGAHLMKWGKESIPDDALAADGRENEPHVTVLYGLENDDREPIQELVSGFGPIQLSLGETAFFEAPDYDVVYCKVNSSDLFRLRGRLETLPHTSTHPVYTPHATIAYVKSGMGKLFTGRYIDFPMDAVIPLPSMGNGFSVDVFYVSGKDGGLHPISTCDKAIKSGRVVSSDNHAHLSELVTKAKGALSDLEAWLSEHGDDEDKPPIAGAHRFNTLSKQDLNNWVGNRYMQNGVLPVYPANVSLGDTDTMDAKSFAEFQAFRYFQAFKAWDESAHSRADNGEFSGGGGGAIKPGASISKDRVTALAKQYGVKNSSVAHSVLQEAYDKGHVKTAADVHNVLSNSAKDGHDETKLSAHINEHGSGNGKFSSFVDKGDKGGKPKDDKPAPSAADKPLSKKDTTSLLQQAGHGPSSTVSTLVNEAVKKGYIANIVDMSKVLREINKSSGSVGEVHSIINLHGNGPKHDGKFRSALVGSKKSWDDVPDDERADAIKTYLETQDEESRLDAMLEEARAI